jgi:hypothetical protein
VRESDSFDNSDKQNLTPAQREQMFPQIENFDVEAARASHGNWAK